MKTTLLTLASVAALSGAVNAQTLTYRMYANGTIDGVVGTADPGVNAIWDFGTGNVIAHGIAYDGTDFYGIFDNPNNQVSLINLTKGTEVFGIGGTRLTQGISVDQGLTYRMQDTGLIDGVVGTSDLVPAMHAVWDFGAGNVIAHDIAFDGTDFYGVFDNPNNQVSLINLTKGTEIFGVGATSLTRAIAVHTVVPEPSSTALLGLGGLALLARRKR